PLSSYTTCTPFVLTSLFFLMTRRTPRSTLFPTRRSSDLVQYDMVYGTESYLYNEDFDEWVAGSIDFGEAGEGIISFYGECGELEDRKSTRLNSSHVSISYAVFCLKKKSSESAQLTRERVD